MLERRFDAARLGTKARKDPRGFLEVAALVTRTGVVAYRKADGTVVRELRHPDDVFAADSLDSLRGAPITIGHPAKDGELIWVDPTNARDLEVGVGGAAEPEDRFVATTLSVRRDDAIARVDSKDLCEISCGYSSEIVRESGVFEGQPYTQRQTNIRYNHIALLGAGKSRMGDTIIRADSADAVCIDVPLEPSAPNPSSSGTQPGGGAMRKVRIDGIEYEIPDPAAAAVDKLLGSHESEKKRADSAEAERDLLKTDLAKATDPKAVMAKVQTRVALERSASRVLGAETRIDGMTDREVQEAVLKKARPDFKLEGRTDDAVGAAFEFAIASLATTDQGLELIRPVFSEQPSPTSKRGDESEDAKALREAEEARRNAWKPRALNGGK